MRISDLSSDVCSSDLFLYVKGQDVLLDAFTAICDEFEDVILVLIGRSGDFLPSLTEMVQNAGIEDRVVLIKELPHERVARSEERRVGKESVSTGRARWSQYHKNKKQKIKRTRK